MNKIILVLGLFIALVAFAEADNWQPQCRPQCRRGNEGNNVCVRNASGKQCRRLKECRMREENCRLLQQGKRVLIEAHRSQCRNIKPNSTGRCARIQTKSAKRVSRCPVRPCKDDGVNRCWRNSQNQCRILRSCQRLMYNCAVPANMALNAADTRACKGMKPGNKLKKCKKVKRG